MSSCRRTRLFSPRSAFCRKRSGSAARFVFWQQDLLGIGARQSARTALRTARSGDRQSLRRARALALAGERCGDGHLRRFPADARRARNPSGEDLRDRELGADRRAAAPPAHERVGAEARPRRQAGHPVLGHARPQAQPGSDRAARPPLLGRGGRRGRRRLRRSRGGLAPSTARGREPGELAPASDPAVRRPSGRAGKRRRPAHAARGGRRRVLGSLEGPQLPLRGARAPGGGALRQPGGRGRPQQRRRASGRAGRRRWTHRRRSVASSPTETCEPSSAGGRAATQKTISTSPPSRIEFEPILDPASAGRRTDNGQTYDEARWADERGSRLRRGRVHRRASRRRSSPRRRNSSAGRRCEARRRVVSGLRRSGQPSARPERSRCLPRGG